MIMALHPRTILVAAVSAAVTVAAGVAWPEPTLCRSDPSSEATCVEPVKDGDLDPPTNTWPPITLGFER
jgi:hypothetical protein